MFEGILRLGLRFGIVSSYSVNGFTKQYRIRLRAFKGGK